MENLNQNLPVKELEFTLAHTDTGAYYQYNKNLMRTFANPLTSLYLMILIDRYREYYSRGVLQDGRFYLTYEKIQEDLSLSTKIIRRLKKQLIEDGIITVQLKGSSPKEYILIDFTKIKKIYKGIFKSIYSPNPTQKGTVNILSKSTAFKRVEKGTFKRVEKGTVHPLYKKNKLNKNKKENIKRKKDQSFSFDGKNKSIYDFPIHDFKIIVSSIQNRYWDSANGCNQYHGLPYNLIRSNPIQRKATTTTPKTSNVKPVKEKEDPLQQYDKECRRIGLKLALIIKAAGKLNPRTNIEDFGKRIKTIIKEDYKTEKERARGLLMLDDLVDKYKNWIGKEYIHIIYSPDSFRQKYFLLKNRIEDQEKYNQQRKEIKDMDTPYFGKGARLKGDTSIFGEPKPYQPS